MAQLFGTCDPPPVWVHDLEVEGAELSRLSRNPRDPFTFQLPFPPLVESWERRDHPSQVRLAEYRETLRTLAEPALDALERPAALGFHVAGRPDIASGCDLDNFLTPVVRALGGGDAFSFVWATRGRPDEHATLTLARAVDARVRMERRLSHVLARVHGSPEKRAWKVAVANAVGVHDSATGSGPIELAIRFGLSPRRNWVSLWKPTIDALGGVLGEGDRAWHPRDDRISLLVLERQLRPELGWDIELDISWATR